MSMSIDGKEWRGNVNVKYGESFPKLYRSIELENETFGRVLIYITSLGTPEWTNKMSVAIPIKYYITQIIEPSKKYLINKKRKEHKLQLIKG